MKKEAYAKLMRPLIKQAAPMDKPTWFDRLVARVFDPHKYVYYDTIHNPQKEQKVFEGLDPHPAATSGMNATKINSLRDYLREAVKRGHTLNPAASDQLELGKLFGTKEKGLHKYVNSPNAAYVDTARVARKGQLARKMLAIRNSTKNKPGMFDILFNRWSWDE